MKSKSLQEDYIIRAEHRLAAIEVLSKRQSWADVVRESQEAVELALKSLLRKSGIEVPRIHDVGDILESQSSLIAKVSRSDIEKMAEISRQLRRDRERAFYGSEDLTPSEFYKKKHADEAQRNAEWVIKEVKKVVL